MNKAIDDIRLQFTGACDAHIQNTKPTQVAAIFKVLTLNFRFIEDRTEEACRF